MYVIAVYDVSAERTVKMLKLCRKYLHWIQNSVFEGELSELQLKKSWILGRIASLYSAAERLSI